MPLLQAYVHGLIPFMGVLWAGGGYFRQQEKHGTTSEAFFIYFLLPDVWSKLVDGLVSRWCRTFPNNRSNVRGRCIRATWKGIFCWSFSRPTREVITYIFHNGDILNFFPWELTIWSWKNKAVSQDSGLSQEFGFQSQPFPCQFS